MNIKDKILNLRIKDTLILSISTIVTILTLALESSFVLKGFSLLVYGLIINWILFGSIRSMIKGILLFILFVYTLSVVGMKIESTIPGSIGMFFTTTLFVFFGLMTLGSYRNIQQYTAYLLTSLYILIIALIYYFKLVTDNYAMLIGAIIYAIIVSIIILKKKGRIK